MLDKIKIHIERFPPDLIKISGSVTLSSIPTITSQVYTITLGELTLKKLQHTQKQILADILEKLENLNDNQTTE